MSKRELNKITKSFFDFIFPRICVSCSSNLNIDENIICNPCLKSIRIIPQDLLKLEFIKKFHNDFYVDDFESLFLFEKEKVLQKILHAYKYEKKIFIGKYLGDLIYSNLGNVIKLWKADLITPVPLHSLKKAERGFNQSFYLAKEIARKLNIPLINRILKRVRFTNTQTKMNLIERKENVKDAFKLNDKKRIIDKKIILVDDVITTGATISECAKVLKLNGAKKVYALSVAIPVDYILSGAETPNIESPFLNTI